MKKFLYIFALLLFSMTATAKKKESLSKILKNPDVEVKYKYAMEFYYKKAITLLKTYRADTEAQRQRSRYSTICQ